MLQSPLIEHLTGYQDGAFLPRGCQATFKVCDPASDELLADLPSYGAAETTAMVEVCARALATPAPIEARQRWLREIAAALVDHREELSRIVTLENGKPQTEARAEVEYAAGFYRSAAENIDCLRPRTLEARPKGLTWTVHARAAGVAGLITPWNFPLAMLAKKLAGALAAGAPSVVKPAEKTPLSCLAFFHLLHRLSLPKGMVALVFGDAPAIGRVLCEHSVVRVISFTGSTAVGRLLASQSAPHMKRLALELGGNAPFVVFDDADLDHAAAELMSSKFRCSGQTCVSANRVYVHEGVADRFTELVVARASALTVGHGLAKETDIGPLIDEAAVAKVESLVKDALDKGARLVLGGLPAAGAAPGTRTFYPPTVLVDVRPGMRVLREEAFGPLVPICCFASEDEVVRAANDTEYGLAAYVFTRSAQRGARVSAALAYGHVAFNSGTGPTPEAPFGGVKQSGYGREGGEEGLLEFAELQTVASSP